jgi:hypothetical protein
VRVEIMGAPKCRNVGDSQSVLMMVYPIISTRTRVDRCRRAPRAAASLTCVLDCARAQVTAIVSLSLLSSELQKTQVLVKLLEWGMTGESSALCQSLMTIAAGVGGSIGSALIADPSKLVQWIDRATPSPNLCALVVALSMLGPHFAATHAFVSNAGCFPWYIEQAGPVQ